MTNAEEQPLCLDDLTLPFIADRANGAGLNDHLRELQSWAYSVWWIYRFGLAQGQRIDYALSPVQHVYLLRYFPLYVECAQQALEQVWGPPGSCSARQVAQLPNHLHAVCLGSGPGSEVVSLCRWLRRHDPQVQVEYLTFDCFDAAPWDGWLRYAEEHLLPGVLGPDRLAEIRVHTGNVLKPETPVAADLSRCLGEADFVTVHHFVSELHGRPHALVALARPLAACRAGTRLLLIERDYPDQGRGLAGLLAAIQSQQPVSDLAHSGWKPRPQRQGFTLGMPRRPEVKELFTGQDGLILSRHCTANFYACRVL
jgi:hypothetical protein